MADAGINLDFLVAEVVGRKFSAVYGFADAEGARRAVPLIKKASALSSAQRPGRSGKPARAEKR